MTDRLDEIEARLKPVICFDPVEWLACCMWIDAKPETMDYLPADIGWLVARVRELEKAARNVAHHHTCPTGRPWGPDRCSCYLCALDRVLDD